jgi:Cu(I)/Ag(I) efflux system membrane fusion protein
MKPIAKLIVVTAVIGAALATGYWWGSRPAAPTANPPEAAARAATPAVAPVVTLKGKGKILYYRNPMGHPDTSPVPKKDSMGMDYLPVHEDEELSDASIVKISTEKIQKLGVKTEVAALRKLSRTVRAVAIVQTDERRQHAVAPKFEGWIHKLYVNTTGQAVRKGDALMEVYSPELITAQHEYLIGRKGMQHAAAEGSPEGGEAMRRLTESTLRRLRNWDISEIDLQALQQEGQVQHYVTLRSAVSGVVLEKLAIEGERFMPGEALYQIADLSKVWMLADVFEQDLAMVHRGQAAAVRMTAYPDKVFDGEVTFIYPTVAPETRTAKVRIELSNKEGLLKPAMYGRVELVSFLGKDKVLTVPESAVLDKGTQQLVLVAQGEGRYEPRQVKLGMHGDGYVEVLEGLAAGEAVVASANFLIDAESNLKAALGGFKHHPAGSHGGNEQPGERKQSGSGASVAVLGSMSHRGEGSIEAMDWARSTVTISHGPIASLDWPPMTMDFRVRDPALLRSLKPGQKVDFEIIEESAGEYVIVRIQSLDSSAAGGQRRH